MARLFGTRRPDPNGPEVALCGALVDSRERWRDLVGLAADLAFETDADGRFVFVAPDPALGWQSALLVGQPAELLLVETEDGARFNPFQSGGATKGHRAWLKRADGQFACLCFAIMPLCDERGRAVGVRGIGMDVTDQDAQEAHVAAVLRRGEVLDHILWRMSDEVLAPRMMNVVLHAIVDAVGAEGAGVVRFEETGGLGSMPYQSGGSAAAVLDKAGSILTDREFGVQATVTDCGRPLLVAPCKTRPPGLDGIAIWRGPSARPWDADDKTLLASASRVVRFVLEHDAIQREMARQARTDPLTGLLNRRAFLEEIERHCERLDREALPGTLLFADLDNFKPVNDEFGHDTGDELLQTAAHLLRRTFRPTDLVARLGGDEFAVWLNGADSLTAAERAEELRTTVPLVLSDVIGSRTPALSMSIGIATRWPGSNDTIDDLTHRADMAMYEVKRNGRGHWRVALDAKAAE